MNHIDDDTLALISLASARPTADEADHLVECALCRGELEALQRTVDLGRDSRGVSLESPSADVWARIKADVALDDTRPPTAVGDRATPQRESGRVRRIRRIRLAVWIPVTAAVAVAGVVGGIAAAPLLHPVAASTSTVAEQATLESLPGWAGAHGTATLRRSASGHLTLTIQMTPGTKTPEAVAGPLREVWLMKPDLSGLMSMGFIDSTKATFTVPTELDVSAYGLVDISAQAADGDPDHSGQSIMRGRLQRSS